MEFGITRNRRTNDCAAPFAATAMFKDPSRNLHAEARRILRAVARVKEPLPGYVHEYMEESSARRSEAYALGSASAAAAEGFAPVAPALQLGVAATRVLSHAVEAEYVYMADRATAPISPCGPSPLKKYKIGL